MIDYFCYKNKEFTFKKYWKIINLPAVVFILDHAEAIRGSGTLNGLCKLYNITFTVSQMRLFFWCFRYLKMALDREATYFFKASNFILRVHTIPDLLGFLTAINKDKKQPNYLVGVMIYGKFLHSEVFTSNSEIKSIFDIYKKWQNNYFYHWLFFIIRFVILNFVYRLFFLRYIFMFNIQFYANIQSVIRGS